MGNSLVRTAQQENYCVVSESIRCYVWKVLNNNILDSWAEKRSINALIHVVEMCGTYIYKNVHTNTLHYAVVSRAPTVSLGRVAWATNSELPAKQVSIDYCIVGQRRAICCSLAKHIFRFLFSFTLFTAARVLTLFKENICIRWPSQKETRLPKEGCTVVNLCAILLYSIRVRKNSILVKMASESGLKQLVLHIACFHKVQSWHLLHSKGLNDHNLYGLYSLYGYM